MSEALRLSRDGRIARLLIDRAAKKNAFTIAMWRQLSHLVSETRREPAIRVLLLESSDPSVFCAGADLDEFATMGEDRALRRESHDAMETALADLADLPIPTIALIGGAAMGAGLALAAACDLRIASSDARFALPPAKLGLVYLYADTERLVALIGGAQVKRLVYSATTIDAVEALRIGLVEEMVEAPMLARQGGALAEQIADNSPHSIKLMKRFIGLVAKPSGALDADATTHFLDAYDGADFREGLAAFRARRKADFSGQS